jgi:hypothetical protein
VRALLLAVPRSMPLCSDLVWLDGDGEMLLVFFFLVLSIRFQLDMLARLMVVVDGCVVEFNELLPCSQTLRF